MRRRLFALLLIFTLFANTASATILATSTFTGTENPLSEGGNWTSVGGSGVQKTGGFAQAVANAEFSQARWSGAALPSNQYETYVINLNIGPTWSVFLALRYNFAANSGYEFTFASDGTWSIGRYDTGVRTTLTSGSGVTWGATETIKFNATASQISVTRNGSAFASTTDATYSGTGLTVAFIPHTVTTITDVKYDSVELGSSDSGTSWSYELRQFQQ